MFLWFKRYRSVDKELVPLKYHFGASIFSELHFSFFHILTLPSSKRIVLQSSSFLLLLFFGLMGGQWHGQ